MSIDLNSVVNNNNVATDSTLVANIDPNSVGNVSSVSVVGMEGIVRPLSVNNNNSIGNGSRFIANVYLDTLNNNNSVGGIFEMRSGGQDIQLNTVPNTSTLGPISLSGQPSLNSVSNQNRVSAISIPNNITIQLTPFVNAQRFGNALFKVNPVDVAPEAPVNPVVRNPNIQLDSNAAKIVKRDFTFSDLSLKMKAHPLTGDITRVFNESAITQSIRNLLLTRPYERPFQPELSSQINDLLFENITPQTERDIEEEVIRVIGNHEPRAVIVNVEVETFPEQNAVSISVEYKNRVLNRVESFDLLLRAA